MKRFFGFLMIMFVAGALSSCNYTILKNDKNVSAQDYGQLNPEEKAKMMSYAFINAKVLAAKCTSCHGTSGEVNLESYESVKRNLGAIERVVFVEGTMPKRGVLGSEEKRMLWNWIRLGAPFLSEQQMPEPEPMIATYDSIRSHVLEPICMTCHNSTGTGKRISLEFKDLIDSPLELVIPGNADESGLVIALERKDDKRMPSAEEGYSALKPEQIQLIREWINDGAK